MITVKNLKKQFERTTKKKKKTRFFAVNDISLEAKDGEIIGILGPNGAGKTTLLRMIGGIMEATSGKVYYDDATFLQDEINIKKKIAYLSGNTKIYQSISPYELMKMCLLFYEYPKEKIEARIKAVDELFNKEDFLSWAKDLFVKLQEAWTARDWSTIRPFETNELFEQHKKQLQGYIDSKQINIMERICVKSASLSDFRQTGEMDVLVVNLSSKMIDYIIDENTNKIIKGDKFTDRHSTYKMVFVRKTGIKTGATTGEIKTTNCPNCGAPTEITSSGKCQYCGSVITTDEHDWALSNLEKIM